jgi:hypothetical protein
MRVLQVISTVTWTCIRSTDFCMFDVLFAEDVFFVFGKTVFLF